MIEYLRGDGVTIWIEKDKLSYVIKHMIIYNLYEFEM